MIKKSIVLTILCALLPASALTEKSKSETAILLVCNKSDNTVSFVDTETLEVLSTATTGEGPHEVAVSPNGKWAVVANYEGPGNSLSLIDIPQMKEVRKIPIGEGMQPHGILITRDGHKIYATCEGKQKVIEIDVQTEKVTRSFETGQSISHMIALTPDEKKAYVANIGSGSVTAIDLHAGKTLGNCSPSCISTTNWNPNCHFRVSSRKLRWYRKSIR